MSTISTIKNLQAKTGYTSFNVSVIHCKAKLPAAVWRSLSVAERPYVCQDITIVAVDDGGETAAVMLARHYDTLIERIRQLETWIGEFIEESDQEEAS
ncbi:MAG TPA: hypothetical protein VGR22_08750 [Thermomicrobiales bacterium]|nr:hypothetical protein [Thermomicrobiales bacterium]